MKITNSSANRSVITPRTQADWKTRSRRRGRTSWRRTMNYASPLLLSLVLIGLGLISSSSDAAGPGNRGGISPGQPHFLTVQPGQPRNLQAETPQISNGALTDQEIQRNPEAFRVQEESGEAPSAMTSVAPGGTLAPDAPALTTTFDAINFNENSSGTGFFQIPPDPAGAVGPTHVVNVVNSHIEWYTKAGVRQNRQRLGFRTGPGAVGSFFESQAPLTTTFDPKVIYDQYSGRFVVVTMERVDGIPNQSRVFLAVSDDSDPNGTWFFQTLITEETIGVNQSWADFPGFAVDSEAVYFTTNMFGHPGQTSTGFTGQRLWIMAKAPWYTGGVATATRYDPSTLASANPAGDAFALSTTMQPTQMYGDSAGGLGTFLIAYSGINDGINVFVQIIQVDSPLSSPTFTGYFSQWGTIAADDSLTAFPGAPQLGTTRTIATNDRRFSQNGVYRNGVLYCAAPIRRPAAAPTDANQVTVHWFNLDPVILNNGAIDPPPTDHGNIGGEDIGPATYTFFPSVAVDSLGNLAVGFAASGSTMYPGAYFAGRLAADAPGTTRGAGGLRAGRDFYIRDFTASVVVTSRWGDYTGMWLDPSDETTFCAFNEYALPRGTNLGGALAEEDGRWGNAWGCFSLSSPAATAAGQVIISEFRLRGPAGTNDEFIELYNNTNAAITVEDINPLPTGTSGWAIVSSDAPAVAKAIIPTGVTIPARGHYLIANNTAVTGYSLGLYPAGDNGTGASPTSTTATAERTYTTDIPDNAGIALFRSATPANYTLTDRLDAVGFASTPAGFFKEGTGIPDIAAAGVEQTLFRNSASGTPNDTDNNVADFVFADPAATLTTAGQRLGAPGPENLTSAIHTLTTGTMGMPVFDTSFSSGSAPNFVYDPTPVANGTAGTITVRRRLVNNTGVSISRVRLRFVDLTTFPQPPGTADLRVLNSTNLTVETPPAQALGGGLNTSVAPTPAVTLAVPLANGANIPVDFEFGVMQTGCFHFTVIAEALPGGANTLFAFGGTAGAGVCAPTAAPANISGTVTMSDGSPLAGVTMNLSGARSARAVTDSNGNYRFSNVDTDNFYTVTPSLVNYHFGPTERSFSLLANRTDAVFTATRDAVIGGNAIDSAGFFVRQHYLDFLGREPDESGFNFWSDQISSCGSDAGCAERRTINVSAAYFLSIEFQQTGGLVDGLYRASYGRRPMFAEFMPDTAAVARDLIVGRSGWPQQLEANKQAFVDAWMQRPSFQAAYGGLTNDGYVDSLISNTGAGFNGDRNALVSSLNNGTMTRAAVLRQVVENEGFISAKRNETFVMMEYFGYLRRDPDASGYQFWLNKLNQFGGNFEQAEMVKAFINSGEYRGRFHQ